MAVLRLLAVSLYLFFLTICPAILIVMVAYFLVPAQFTLIVMGGFLALTALAIFGFYAVMAGVAISGLGLRSRSAPRKLMHYPENIEALRETLEQRGFRHYGDWYSDKFFSKEKRLNLIYLSRSRQIAAELRQDDEGKAKIIYSSVWDNGQFLVTEYDGTGYHIVKNHYRYISVKNGDDAAYKHHVEQLKEVEELWGNAAQIQSLEQLQKLEVTMLHIGAADILYAAAMSVIPSVIGTTIPLLALSALPVAGAAFSQALPEAENISKEAPGILFVVMTALVVLAYQCLLKPSLAAKPKKASDT